MQALEQWYSAEAAQARHLLSSQPGLLGAERRFDRAWQAAVQALGSPAFEVRTRGADGRHLTSFAFGC